MKRVKSLVALCLAVSLLVGCGGKPKDVSQETYDLGVEILDVTDQYLADDVGLDEAIDEVNVAKSEIVKQEGFNGDTDVRIAASGIILALNKVNGEASKSEIKELKKCRSELKKALGK